MLHRWFGLGHSVRRSVLFLWLGGGVVISSGCGDDSDPPPATPTPSFTVTATNTPTQTVTPTVTPTATPTVPLAILHLADQQLSLAGPMTVTLALPPGAADGSLAVTLDGAVVSSQFTTANGQAVGTLANVAEGWHRLSADIQIGTASSHAEVSFETVALDNPDECEVLNNAECLLPYPSSRFLEPADTPTGWRVRFPASGMPAQRNTPLPPDPYAVLDGFSPTVQILMHFPGGVDPVASNASRLLPETRTYSVRSLDADSPTVLLDADTGERILHFIEPDARAADKPARQALFLRPAKSLTPGHHYIVAVRHLVHRDGTPVTAEPVFAALRDRRPTDITAVASRRAHFEDLFTRLAAAGVSRGDLVLAFDFVTQSDAGLTGQMLAMRDQAFTWLAQQAAAGTPTFTVDTVNENDCSQPGVTSWREVQGTYQVPLFLTSDPAVDPVTPGLLNVDANGVPVQNGLTTPPFTIGIPCSVLTGGAKPAVMIGHGLFGSGRGTIEDFAQRPQLSGFDYVTAATDWWGLSAPDIENFGTSFIVSQVVFQLKHFAALPDRLRQGQLNTLLLARMVKSALFNADAAFQTPAGAGVFIAQGDEYYFGASLGGIMGLMFTALSPDIVNANVDVPAINFSLLLQRAVPFIQFDGALVLSGITDPMKAALLIGIIHELWVRGESAGYATHITSNPLPGTNAKHILMTMAWLDQQVSNQATEVTARTLGLPNLVGSLRNNLPLIPDQPGPLDSALVIYDTGSFDPDNPAHTPFIPPLTNQPPQQNDCDPHGMRGFIPDSIQQLIGFFQPGGQIVSHCNGLCDAGEPAEIPFGDAAPCDPLATL